MIIHGLSLSQAIGHMKRARQKLPNMKSVVILKLEAKVPIQNHELKAGWMISSPLKMKKLINKTINYEIISLYYLLKFLFNLDTTEIKVLRMDQ